MRWISLQFIFVLHKLEEYSRLEEKLKQSIADLERREKQLSASETQVCKIMFWFSILFLICQSVLSPFWYLDYYPANILYIFSSTFLSQDQF